MNKVSQTLYGLKGLVRIETRKAIASKLLNYGAELIKRAVETKQYQNRTGCLVASYGVCLYYDGREWDTPVEKTPAMDGVIYEAPGRLYSMEGAGFMVEQKNRVEGWSGFPADYLDHEFNEYDASASKGKWQLAFIAAMFYAGAVESKGYDVISQVAAEMAISDIATKLNGIAKPFPNKWNKGQNKS